MIAISRPVSEFVPSGRLCCTKHAHANNKHLFERQHRYPSSQNMSSCGSFIKETWYLKESSCHSWSENDDPSQENKHNYNCQGNCFSVRESSMNEFICEEELYVSSKTVVWTKSHYDSTYENHQISFTCDTPVQFAFYCMWNLSQNNEKSDRQQTVCVIDSKSLKVYCSDGEEYLANLEFPISKVWPTSCCLLIEKMPCLSTLPNVRIVMPRFFSLIHPMGEFCPVIMKSPFQTNVQYVMDTDLVIIHSSDDTDVIMMYDKKLEKHLLFKVRKATSAEVYADFKMSANKSNYDSAQSFFHTGTKINDTDSVYSNMRELCRNVNHEKCDEQKNASTSHQKRYSNRSLLDASLRNVNSIKANNSTALPKITKNTNFKPAKSIGPEMCLEHIWEEEGKNSEIAIRAFIHIDIVGRKFFCYVLPRRKNIRMVLLSGMHSSCTQIAKASFNIVAIDAICLPRMNVVAILTSSNDIDLYTGPSLLCKLHILPGPEIQKSSDLMCKDFGYIFTSNKSKLTGDGYHRRIHLLPAVPSYSTLKFDKELHLLSPVHPLPQAMCNRHMDTCAGLRDAVGNRVTLTYSSGRMFRISLPLLNESNLVRRCIKVLRSVILAEAFFGFIAAWYRTRNTPGSQNLSAGQEWYLFKYTLLNHIGWPESAVKQTVERDDLSSGVKSLSPNKPKKRKKHIKNQSEENGNWDFLKETTAAKTNSNISKENSKIDAINSSAPLFAMTPIIFYSFHLLYEDIKLDVLHKSCLSYLVELLHQVAFDMHLPTYTMHYAVDFPKLANNTNETCRCLKEQYLLMIHKELLRIPADGIFNIIDHLMQTNPIRSYTFIDDVNELSKNLVELVALLWHGPSNAHSWSKKLSHLLVPKNLNISKYNILRSSRHLQVLEVMKLYGFSQHITYCFPPTIQLVLADCLGKSRLFPPLDGSSFEYNLIMRPELAAHSLITQKGRLFKKGTENSLTACVTTSLKTYNMIMTYDEESDGMEHIDTKLLRLRFPDDMRVYEVRRLLSSSKPIPIDITQSPGISDHDFIEEKEKHLFALCARTMALPIGRGILTLQTWRPSITGSMPIPKLCLVGKESKQGTCVEMQQIEFPANMHLWPSFHNGVAAGLKISTDALHVDSTWITCNRNQPDMILEHAGFLMGLGLNGHLKMLSFMNIYDYLVKCDEMTTIGLLLGISATHRGTMNRTTAKLLSVHLEALLPITAFELDIPQNIQVAALMGIGLLYQGSAKRHIAEVLLNEIGRPPGPEMENSSERESYALAAGLALGMVTLGQGETSSELRDLQLPDMLHYYIVGGITHAISKTQKQKFKQPSFKVREGDSVNIDITAPGATLALGLMFFKTNNTAISDWMQPPGTSYLLSLIRPDLLQLRIISRNLILWEQIEPSKTWLEGQLPKNLEKYLDFDELVFRQPDDKPVDKESVAQTYCNILAASAFCIGLKFAGTDDNEAYSTLMGYIKLFLGLPGTLKGEMAGRTTVESCLMILIISISLVCAGSGNCNVLRIIRYLRSRTGNRHSYVTYGSHLATHMALGFLFVGGGRYTISKAPEAVAALICALFPKFPIHSNDNRYHLQAFRHLYVLAIEPRLLLTRDIETGQLCPSYVAVLEIGSKNFHELPISPCFLPELANLRKVIIHDENYWPVCFEKDRNWDQLLHALRHSESIAIKKRTGCLSHIDDPCRLRSLLAQTLTADQTICWKIDGNDIQHFATEQMVPTFLNRFSVFDSENPTNKELARIRHLSLLFYSSVVKDNLHILSVHLSLYKDSLTVTEGNNAIDIWQLKLADKYAHRNIWNSVQISSLELTQMILESSNLNTEALVKSYGASLVNILGITNLRNCFWTELNEKNMNRVLTVVNFYNLNSITYENFLRDISSRRSINLLLKAISLNIDPKAMRAIFQMQGSTCTLKQ